MKYLFIETFYAGSHAQFANGLARHSAHEIDIFDMPGENFRWRMLGAGLYLADTITTFEHYDGLIITDLFNLADFKALLGTKCPPVLAYFHENQLTYPQPAGDKSVLMLGMINITTALIADRVVFNSNVHREAFLKAIPAFFNRKPDCPPKGVARRIRQKSHVLYPGVDIPRSMTPGPIDRVAPPLIIWNHRWGFDKNYTQFFTVVDTLREKGVEFRLAVLGEHTEMIPEAFLTAKRVLGDTIVHFGYVSSRSDYIAWLKKGSIVISTAIQENFGISVIEAILMGCIPLLPNRLSYPEILPNSFHAQCLYKNKHELLEKLCRITSNPAAFEGLRKRLVQAMRSFLWDNVIADFDMTLEQLGNC